MLQCYFVTLLLVISGNNSNIAASSRGCWDVCLFDCLLQTNAQQTSSASSGVTLLLCYSCYRVTTVTSPRIREGVGMFVCLFDCLLQTNIQQTPASVHASWRSLFIRRVLPHKKEMSFRPIPSSLCSRWKSAFAVEDWRALLEEGFDALLAVLAHDELRLDNILLRQYPVQRLAVVHEHLDVRKSKRRLLCEARG